MQVEDTLVRVKDTKLSVKDDASFYDAIEFLDTLYHEGHLSQAGYVGAIREIVATYKRTEQNFI